MRSVIVCDTMLSMKKIFLVTISILMILALPLHVSASSIADLPVKKGQEGNDVVILQQRLADLGYLHFRATGYYGDMTVDAVKAFQARNKLERSGQIDSATYVKLFAREVVRGSAGTAIRRVTGPRLLAKGEAYGELIPWKTVNSSFTEGTRAKVQDLYTGYTYTVIRVAGRNHADVQPASEADLSTYKKCFGGAFTWEKRPAVVEIDGVLYAASVFGYPNGNTEVNYCSLEGCICVYFYESTSDIGGIADSEHTTNVYLASSPAGAVR